MRRIAHGVGIALAVSFPPVVLAAILMEVNDGREKLGPVLRILLPVIVLCGPIVGGASVAGRGGRVLSVLVGALGLVAIVALGLARQAAADNDPNVAMVPFGLLVGGVLGWVGGTARAIGPGRTRS